MLTDVKIKTTIAYRNKTKYKTYMAIYRIQLQSKIRNKFQVPASLSKGHICNGIITLANLIPDYITLTNGSEYLLSKFTRIYIHMQISSATKGIPKRNWPGRYTSWIQPFQHHASSPNKSPTRPAHGRQPPT